MSQKGNVQPIQERPDEQVSEIQPVQAEETNQQRQIQQPEEKSEIKQIKMNEIVKELGVEKEREFKIKEVVLTHAQPPEVKNPVFVYKGPEKYDWNVGQLDATICIQKIQNKFAPDLFEFPFVNEVNITVTTVNNVKGHLQYTLKISDKNGEREVLRRYTQFILLRNKLVDLWPAIMFCTFPNRSNIGVSQVDLIRKRSQYISRFFRNLSRYQAIYYSDEMQTFLKNSESFNLQAYLENLSIPTHLELLEKYKKYFPQDFQYSMKQDFLYRKEEVATALDQYQVYFSKKKIDLSDYLGDIARMAESKQKYFRAASRLNTQLLMDYQDTISRWINNQPLPQSPLGIIQRLSFSKPRKSSISQIQKEVKENQLKQGKQQQVQIRDRKISKQPNTEKEQSRQGLLALQAYKSRLEDIALLIHDYNGSSWRIYDFVKYQLKEIDSVIGAIEQTKVIFRQVIYLKRTIAINKEQIQALNNNKTTIKTFFMQGNSEQKKTKLTSDNQILEEKLVIMQQFYNLLMFLLQKQLKQHHYERSSFYRKSITKAFTDELGISRSIMDFHIYEEQLFAKELNQRLDTLRQESPLKVDQLEKQQQRT